MELLQTLKGNSTKALLLLIVYSVVMLEMSSKFKSKQKQFGFARMDSAHTNALKRSQASKDGEVRKRPEMTECGLRLESRISSKPLINLRKDRFLFPMLCNGPTNQLVGMRDTIYLAILLNRTVIMPKFRKHFTDSTGALDLVEPEMRVDVSDMTSLASTVDHSALWEECGNKMDIAFRGRGADTPGFVVSEKNNKLQNVTVDFDKARKKYNVVGFQHPKVKLATHFKSDLKCAGYVCPYRSVGVREKSWAFKEAKKILKERELPLDVANMSKNLLYAMVFLSSGRPRFVKEISQNFIDDVMGGGDYVAIHWRFDPKDWLYKCRHSNSGRCADINSISGQDILNTVLRHLDKKLKRQKQVTSVYFASPLNQEKIISQVREAARRHIRSGRAPKVRLYQFDDLQRHLRRHENCSGFADKMEDILGSVEMEVCTRSRVFFSSQASSWSVEVGRQRESRFNIDLDLEIVTAVSKFKQGKL